MLNNEIMRNAIEHYAKTRDIKNFKYDGLKGFLLLIYMLQTTKNSA